MSTSDINDELDSLKNKGEKKVIKNINDILKNNIENIEKYVNNRVINIYSRPWNKLEPKLKKKKLNEYLDKLMFQQTITLKECNNIIYKAHKDLEDSKQAEFNKKLKIDYDTEKCILIFFDYTYYL